MSVSVQKAAFATGVPPDIYEFHLYTRNSAFLSLYSRKAVSKALPRLSRGLSPLTYQTTYVRFTPNKSEQRSPPLSYRGCWHGVSRGFFCGTVDPPDYLPREHSFPSKGVYNPKPSSPTRRCCVRLSPIAQYSPLLPPVGVWTVSQFQCG